MGILLAVASPATAFRSACFLGFLAYVGAKFIIGESVMNLEFTAEEKAFRDEVRNFIENNYPQNIERAAVQDDMSPEDMTAWHKILGEKGWSVPAWPEQYGGTGWTPTQRYIWSEENARVNAVMPLPFGVAMVAQLSTHSAMKNRKPSICPVSAAVMCGGVRATRNPVPVLTLHH